MKRRQSNPSKTGGKGSTRMREFGYTAVTVWLDKSELKAIDQEAAKVGMKRASYLRKHGLAAAGYKFIYK